MELPVVIGSVETNGRLFQKRGTIVVVDMIDSHEAVYIDNKRITNVISPDGVKAERQGETATIVTISFIAKSYRKIN